MISLKGVKNFVNIYSLDKKLYFLLAGKRLIINRVIACLVEFRWETIFYVRYLVI